MDKGTLFDKFLKTNAPVFTGTGGDRDADIWLHNMDKIFDRLKGSDAQRVSLATYKLQGPAEDWWDATQRQYGDKKHELTWEKFKKLFLDEYYPWTLRKNKKSELLNISQGDMTVADYQIKFNELSRYAPEMVATQEDKVMLFENGLNSAVKERYIMCQSSTFYEAIENAKNAETSCGLASKRQEQFQKRQREQPHRASQGRGGDYSNKRVLVENSSGGGHVQHRYPCSKCGRFHPSAQYCDGKTKKCYNCGKDGHLSYNCQSPKSVTVEKTSSQSTTRASNTLQPKGAVHGQKSGADGHVYALTKEQAEASASVVQGS